MYIQNFVGFFGVWENLAFCFQDLLTFSIVAIFTPLTWVLYKSIMNQPDRAEGTKHARLED